MSEAMHCLNLPTTGDSFTTKPVHEPVSIARGRLVGVVRVSRERRIFPRRYQANGSQPYTLIGLTVDETREFERLDHLSVEGHSDACKLDGEPPAPDERRWLELYRKHEIGWSAWLAAERGSTAAYPFGIARRSIRIGSDVPAREAIGEAPV